MCAVAPMLHISPSLSSLSGTAFYALSMNESLITTATPTGNDFIDLSNIVGAGGNLTVQQVGKPSTLEGDPLFMQHLNTAWSHASAATKSSLKDCVHLNKEGKVVRIDAIKNFPELEKFVRTFADGKTYIGVGAWRGSPGNASDNGLSRAAQGSTDILITFSDGDATPPKTGQWAHRAVVVNHEEKVEVASNGVGDGIGAVSKEESHGNVLLAQKSTQIQQGNNVEHATTIGANGPGIVLHNKSNKEQTYYFYDNLWNGNGTAGANFDHPLTSRTLHAGTSTFVPLSESFKGRVQRGTLIPATWVEFQVKASNDGAAHGDISLEQGCDGAATIRATDGSGRSNGFTEDILKGAPEAAVVKRSDGVRVLQTTVGNWESGPNQAAIEYERKVVGQKKAYITGGTGTDDVASKNNRFEVDFF